MSLAVKLYQKYFDKFYNIVLKYGIIKRIQMPIKGIRELN